MKTSIAVTLTAAALALAGCVPNPEKECYERPVEKDGPWILTDHYHARKQNNEDYVLTKDTFNYQGVFGFRRAFNHLEKAGYNWASIRTMELSPERLEGFDVLFINLVSGTRPDFTDDEVDTIIDFVDQGGGLFVIADHTNVYHHAERVNRFLKPMGVEVLYHIAVDYPPEHAVAGLGWILVDNLTDHPIAEDLDMVSLQTGGPMESDGPVALTSEESFADFWDPEDDGGFYGNWKFDGDEEVEPKGPLQVFAGVEYGEGRVVVAGDQNMFGDAWLHMVDNFELMMNSFEWAAQQEDKAEVRLRDVRPKGTIVGLEQPHSDFKGGSPGGKGYFVFFVNLNRDHDVTGTGNVRLDNEQDVLMMLNPRKDFSDDEVEDIREYLDAGKKVFVTFEPDDISPAAAGLLARLAPEFSMKAGDTTARADEDGALEGLQPVKIEGDHLPLKSDYLDVDGLELASWDGDPSKDDSDPNLKPYLWRTTSSWGKPFLQATADGETIDIARRKKFGDGELVIFIQDNFWKNQTMGKYLRPPRDYNRDAHELQYRLLEYVKLPEFEDDSDDTDVPATRVCK